MIERFELFTTTIGQIYKNLQRIKMQEMAEFQLREPMSCACLN